MTTKAIDTTDYEAVTVAICIAMVFIVFIVMVAFNARNKNLLTRTAIEHGCAVNSAGIICAQGDRK